MAATDYVMVQFFTSTSDHSYDIDIHESQKMSQNMSKKNVQKMSLEMFQKWTQIGQKLWPSLIMWLQWCA